MSKNILVSTGTSDRVPFSIDSYGATSYIAISEARKALDELGKSRPTFPDGGAVPGDVTASITFNKPGNVPEWNYNFAPPKWNITDPVLNPVTKTVVKDFTGTPPPAVTPTIPNMPNPVDPTAPKDAPIVGNVVIPDVPTLKDIADPKEWNINITQAPNIRIDDFIAKRPTTDVKSPIDTFNWQEDPYTSQTLTDLVDQVANFNTGGVGIPDIVWDAIWAKSKDREDKASLQQIVQINEEWASKGFSLPQGVQVAQVQEVQQKQFESDVNRSREMAIREADIAIENLKFAVQQGIALENLRGSWYQQTQDRMLQAAKYISELSIAVFNAKLSLYNAHIQLYQADMEVYKTQLEAELAKLEAYKSELEGQKIIGELNLQQVQIYTSKVQALNLEIDRYSAVVNALKTSVEVDAIKIEAYKAEVQTYSEKIKAINSQYEGYQTAMQGAKLQSDIYETNVKAFASTVQAYTAKVDAEARNTQIDIDVNKYKLEEYNLKIQSFIAELDAEVKSLEAESAAFDAEVKGYTSKLAAEKVSVDAQVAKFNGDIQLANGITNANIQNAKTNAQNALAEAKIIQEGLTSIAQVNAAYANSALSAVNLSMGMSDSASNSASV